MKRKFIEITRCSFARRKWRSGHEFQARRKSHSHTRGDLEVTQAIVSQARVTEKHFPGPPAASLLSVGLGMASAWVWGVEVDAVGTPLPGDRPHTEHTHVCTCS